MPNAQIMKDKHILKNIRKKKFITKISSIQLFPNLFHARKVDGTTMLIFKRS